MPAANVPLVGQKLVAGMTDAFYAAGGDQVYRGGLH